ncbi:MAG TPA: PDZ domain-containing protein [Pirellulales bacterium]|jgi:membrane-associated protease RseP (regulator of RpoE activity)
MNLRLALCIGFASQCLAGAAWAQPALERVEQQLRKQVPTRTAAANDSAAADDPAGGKNSPGYLGIVGDDRQDENKGVRVMKTDAGGPADKGGLKADDLITAIDDQPVTNLQDMTDILGGRHAGAVVKFSVERKGESRDVQVRLERRPPPDRRLLPQFGKQAEDMPPPGGPAPGAPAPGNAAPGADPGSSVILNTRRPKLGVITDYLTPFIREQFRLPGSYVAGVLVTFVDPDAPAGKAGLPKHAIITSVDGAPIDSPDTLASVVHRAAAGQTLNVTYYFRDHETQAAITLAGGPPQPPGIGPQATVRAKPIPRVIEPPAQPPGFVPDEPDAADTPPPVVDVAALEHRIAELEKRVAELEAAAEADKK